MTRDLVKTTTLTLWLRVENNSKFVRGKKRARADIEAFHPRRYGIKNSAMVSTN